MQEHELLRSIALGDTPAGERGEEEPPNGVQHDALHEESEPHAGACAEVDALLCDEELSAGSAPLPAEAQLLAWLVARGYQVGVMCSLLYTMDRRGHGHGHVYPLYSWDPCRNRATHRATLHPR